MKRKRGLYPVFVSLIAIALLGTACTVFATPEGQAINFETYTVHNVPGTELTLRNYNTQTSCFLRNDMTVTVDPEPVGVIGREGDVYEMEEITPDYVTVSCDGAIGVAEFNQAVESGVLVGKDRMIYTSNEQIKARDYNAVDPDCYVGGDEGKPFKIDLNDIFVAGLNESVYVVSSTSGECTNAVLSSTIDEMMMKGEITRLSTK